MGDPLWQRVLNKAVGVFSSEEPAIPVGTNPIRARQIVNQAQQGDGGIDIGLGDVLPGAIGPPGPEGRRIMTPWGVEATLYAVGDPRYDAELDRLFASIDQEGEHFIEQKTGRDIAQVGIARYGVAAYMRNQTLKDSGVPMGQHDPIKKAQGALRRNTLTDAQMETPETRGRLDKRLGQLAPGAQPLADPIVSNLLGRKPKGFI